MPRRAFIAGLGSSGVTAGRTRATHFGGINALAAKAANLDLPVVFETGGDASFKVSR